MLVSIAFIVFIYKKVKRYKLSEKESGFWIIGALLMMIVALFPAITWRIANFLNIEYAPSLLFFLGIIFLLGLVFRLTSYVSILKEEVKELAQINTVLEKRLSDLEKYIDKQYKASKK